MIFQSFLYVHCITLKFSKIDAALNFLLCMALTYQAHYGKIFQITNIYFYLIFNKQKSEIISFLININLCKINDNSIFVF